MNAPHTIAPERSPTRPASPEVAAGSDRAATRLPLLRVAGAVAVLLAVVWAYWTTFLDIAERWATDPQYSHGFLVPVFAGYLLWSRRSQLGTNELCGRWWGVGLVLGGAAIRLVGHVFYLPWVDGASLLVVLAGIAGAAGGRRMLVWAGPAILFLAFMIPLPHRFQSVLGGTLQRTATVVSTYVLQTFGVPAVAEGNVILLSETRLGVVEACSGLTMLVTFFALAAGMAMLAQRTWIEKGIIVLSAIPIAIIANVVRITVTGMLYEANHNELARSLFHDMAGWLMMPLGLILLLGELYVLGRLIVPPGKPSGKQARAG